MPPLHIFIPNNHFDPLIAFSTGNVNESYINGREIIPFYLLPSVDHVQIADFDDHGPFTGDLSIPIECDAGGQNLGLVLVRHVIHQIESRDHDIAIRRRARRFGELAIPALVFFQSDFLSFEVTAVVLAREFQIWIICDHRLHSSIPRWWVVVVDFASGTSFEGEVFETFVADIVAISTHENSAAGIFEANVTFKEFAGCKELQFIIAILIY